MKATDQLACITVYMDGERPCLRTGEHLWDALEYDGEERHNLDCGGCQPRRAEIGLVCLTCYDRIEAALATWRQWEPMLSGVDRAIRRESARSGKPGSQVPIPPVPLAMEELRSYLRHYTGTAERWVASVAGAEDAIRFARAMPAAAEEHPTHEVPHPIARTRCPDCEKLTLVWNPPAYDGADVRVICRDRSCGYEADQSSFEDIAEIEAPGSTNGPRPVKVIHERVTRDECSCGEHIGPDSIGWPHHVLELMEEAS